MKSKLVLTKSDDPLIKELWDKCEVGKTKTLTVTTTSKTGDTIEFDITSVDYGEDYEEPTTPEKETTPVEKVSEFSKEDSKKSKKKTPEAVDMVSSSY